MAVKLGSLERWSVLPKGEAIVFPGSAVAERRVRINLNLEAVTTFYINQYGGTLFLATLGPGLETLEFHVRGEFKLIAEETAAAVHYQSADLEPNHFEVVDPKIFTKIASRRHRNPELEEIMYRMELNMQRRLAKQADEMERLLEMKRKEIENGGKTSVDSGADKKASEPAARNEGKQPDDTGAKPVAPEGSKPEASIPSAAS